MRTKQRSIRIFEIECDDFNDTILYLQKNFELLKGLLVATKGVAAAQVCDWANQNNLCAFVFPSCLESPKKQTSAKPKLSLFDEDALPIEQELPQKESAIDNMQIAKKMSINRVLRSGEIITTDGDVTVFGRINSGAKIVAKGIVEVFDEIDGLVECEGEYMILRTIGKGSVVFGSEIVKKEILKWDLQKIYFENGTLVARKI